MSLALKIRSWLSLDTMHTQIDRLCNEQHQFNTELNAMQYDLQKLTKEIKIHNLALGRIIAKLDPMYAIDEADPKQRADSDILGAQALDRIAAEFAALRNQGEH